MVLQHRLDFLLINAFFKWALNPCERCWIVTAVEDEFMYFSAEVVQPETVARHASLMNISEP